LSAISARAAEAGAASAIAGQETLARHEGTSDSHTRSAAIVRVGRFRQPAIESMSRSHSAKSARFLIVSRGNYCDPIVTPGLVMGEFPHVSRRQLVCSMRVLLKRFVYVLASSSDPIRTLPEVRVRSRLRQASLRDAAASLGAASSRARRGKK
jgi:hypothetical protein